MLDRVIVVAVICPMLFLFSARVRGQEPEVAPPPDDARASVELSLSAAPQLLLGRALPGAGGLGGVGGLGNASFPLLLDVAFALTPSMFLSLGMSGSFSGISDTSSTAVSIPLSLLFYLEPPRVGQVQPILRVGGAFGYSLATSGVERGEVVSGQLLVRGGITWMAARCFALRAELGIVGGVAHGLGAWDYTGVSVGFDASVGVVLRV